MFDSGGCRISVVIPAYQSSGSLPELISRLEAILTKSAQSFEIIIVEDFSVDGTWEVLKLLKNSRPHLKIIRLVRNFGQHNAIICGFSLAQGDVIVTMDDDLQHPPEEIFKLLAAINEGYDLVIGAYESKEHALWRNFGSKLIDNLQRWIFKLPKGFQLTSFRALRRDVLNKVVEMREPFPYVTSMLLTHSNRYVNVPVRHEPRALGKSNYNIKRSLLLAFNLLLTYSFTLRFFVPVRRLFLRRLNKQINPSRECFIIGEIYE